MTYAKGPLMNRVFVFLGTVTIVAALQAQAQNLLVNGSFESGAWSQNSIFAGRMSVPNASTTITGWVTGVGPSGNLWWLQGPTHYNPQDGTYAVDLDSNLTTPMCYIQQTFSTTIGQQYLVSAYFATQGNAGPTTAAVQINGNSIGTVSFGAAVSGPEPDYNYLIWTPFSFTFTATTSSSTLRFQDTTTGSFYGPIVDNASVIAVPEPSACAMGILLAGLIAKRR